jgi:hypothetical protein
MKFLPSRLKTLADLLDVQSKSIKGLNAPDKGELHEIFIKDFLEEAFSGVFRINRGGNIIDSNDQESQQIDIVLSAQRSIKLFRDKGQNPNRINHPSQWPIMPG